MNQVVVEAIGARVAIDLTGLPPGDRSTVAALWADASVGLARSGGTLVSVELGTAFEFSSVLADLSTRVTVAALGARRGEVWMLHACGVADEQGRVAVFVGPSGAGKTTAAAVLGREFGYVSDESIGITASGGVLAYRKPLSIVRARESVKEQVAPSDLGLRPLPDKPLTVSSLIVLDRRRDPAGPIRHPTLTPVPDSVAIATLAEQSSFLTAMPSPLRTVSTHLRRVGGVHRLAYDDAEDLPDVVARLLSDPPRAEEAETDHDSTGILAALQPVRSERDDRGPTYTQSPFVDAVTVENGQIALLRAIDGGPAQVLVLAPHAAAVWRTAVDAVTLNDETLRRVADELVEHGLLVRQ